MFFVLACFSSFIAVAFGAFGAHALKTKIAPEFLSTFEIGVRYQLFHSIAIFVVAWASSVRPEIDFEMAGWLFVAGIVLFSVSLYLLSLTGLRQFAIITPLGGMSFLAGWIWLGWKAMRGL